MATLEKEKRSILRSIRLNPSLDKKLGLIASYEDRTISQTIQRFLTQSVDNYYSNNTANLSFYCSMHELPKKEYGLSDIPFND